MKVRSLMLNPIGYFGLPYQNKIKRRILLLNTNRVINYYIILLYYIIIHNRRLERFANLPRFIVLATAVGSQAHLCARAGAKFSQLVGRWKLTQGHRNSWAKTEAGPVWAQSVWVFLGLLGQPPPGLNLVGGGGSIESATRRDGCRLIC